MRKAVLYIAMSLDGYIAKMDMDVSWLSGDGSDPENMGSYPEFYETIDTVIMGWNTYHQIRTELSPDVWPYEGKTTWVVTHRDEEDCEEIHFTKKNLPELIGQLQQQQGKDIWICGGARVAQQLIGADLIDRFCISVIPAILGDGIRLFPNGSGEKTLKLIHTEHYNGIVDLVYEKR